MKCLAILLLCLGANTLCFAQDDYYLVKAERGDGIFSILRKQGLDPVKHYEAFIALNEKDIKNGSLLHIGREYKIPNAADSYKKKGVLLSTDEGGEEPIFNIELGKMSHKGKALKNAVYYIITEDSLQNKNQFVDEMAKNLAAKLLEQGATVYIMDDESKAIADDANLRKVDQLGNYIQIINKRYLQNHGKYQRLLVIQANGLVTKGSLEVSVFHHEKSEQSLRFAENLQKVFRQHSISNRSSNDIKIFEDKNTLFLAKNSLPAVSLISIAEVKTTGVKQGIPVRSDKRKFANWITNGILKDYAEIQFEN
ncbi:MAG: hypothetical protein AAF969_16110 [Bacteroidota bacterium]